MNNERIRTAGPDVSSLKPCAGCKHLNDRYQFGPVCLIGWEKLPNDPYTVKEMRRTGFVNDVRSENGKCGPEARLYEAKKPFWVKALFLMVAVISATVWFLP